jgi:hypothetical protein
VREPQQSFVYPVTVRVLVDHPHMILEEHAADLLVARVHGEAEVAAVDEVFELVRPILRERAPVRIIVDGRRISDLSLSARWRLAMNTRDNRPFIRHTFVYGLSDPMNFAARVILRVSGRDNIEVVGSEQEAFARASELGGVARP